MGRAWKEKPYDLVLVGRRGRKFDPVRVKVDVEDLDDMRRHLVDLAVKLDDQNAAYTERWLGDYLLEVYEPSTYKPLTTLKF